MKITFKYIIVRHGAILFNENITHADVAHGFPEVYSAGFVIMSDAGCKCTGESTSIGIKSHPELDELIVGDFFRTLSKIKYYGLNVDTYYREAGIEPLILKP